MCKLDLHLVEIAVYIYACVCLGMVYNMNESSSHMKGFVTCTVDI